MREELKKKWNKEKLSSQDVEEIISHAKTLSAREVISYWTMLANMSPNTDEIAMSNIKAVHSFFGPEIVRIFQGNPELFRTLNEEAANNAR